MNKTYIFLQIAVAITIVNVVVTVINVNIIRRPNCFPTQEITSEAQLITAYKQGQESMK